MVEGQWTNARVLVKSVLHLLCTLVIQPITKIKVIKIVKHECVCVIGSIQETTPNELCMLGENEIVTHK